MRACPHTFMQQFLLDPPPLGAVVDDWSADGRWLIFRHIASGVFALPMAGERKPRRIAEMHGADSVHLSPSGRWMAFTDTTSGRAEVSIVTFPGFTDKRQVSRGAACSLSGAAMERSFSTWEPMPPSMPCRSRRACR